MRLLDRFKAGFEIGIRTNISHTFFFFFEKAEWKAATKWIKADEKARRKELKKEEVGSCISNAIIRLS